MAKALCAGPQEMHDGGMMPLSPGEKLLSRQKADEQS